MEAPDEKTAALTREALSDTDRRFSGVARVYGSRALEHFRTSRVAVIGVGGVGSWTVEALARSGVGTLVLFDPDHAAESNINRQLHALDSTLGKAKVQVLRERIADINPDCRVETVEDFVTPGNLEPMLVPGNLDYVVDCSDSFRTKAAIIAHARRTRMALLTVGGAGGQQDPTRIRVVDLSRSAQDPLLAKVRRLLRQQYGFSRNPKRRFDVPCVYSDEQMVFPGADGGVCLGRPAGTAGTDLSCAGGLGSAVTVTASFGFAAAARCLAHLARLA